MRKLNGGKGVDYVVECSGAPNAVNEAIRMVNRGGKVCLAAFPHEETPVDVAHIVRNNIYLYGIRGEGKSATHRAEAFMSQKRFDATKVHTHTFPLEDLPTAIKYARERIDDAIKVVVKTRGCGRAARRGGIALSLPACGERSEWEDAHEDARVSDLGRPARCRFACLASRPDLPPRPVTVIVPFPAGGPSDVVARIVTEQMGKVLGQTMVIENVGGAGGTIGIGARRERRARRLHAARRQHGLACRGAGAHAERQVRSARDFEPIGFTAHAPAVIVARKDFPAKDLRRIRRLAEAEGRERQAGAWRHRRLVAYGVPAVHRRGRRASRRWSPIAAPGPAMNDLIGGHVDFFCEQAVSVAAQINSGAVKAYAVSCDQRLRRCPKCRPRRSSASTTR